MYCEPEFDMSPEEIYGEGPKTWAFHHYGWSAAAIAEMKATGEWYEDLDADEEDYCDSDDEDPLADDVDDYDAFHFDDDEEAEE